MIGTCLKLYCEPSHLNCVCSLLVKNMLTLHVPHMCCEEGSHCRPHALMRITCGLEQLHLTCSEVRAHPAPLPSIRHHSYHDLEGGARGRNLVRCNGSLRMPGSLEVPILNIWLAPQDDLE